MIILGSLFSSGIWYVMCNEIKNAHLLAHSTNASIGANLISNIIETLYNAIDDDVINSPKYTTLSPKILREKYTNLNKNVPTSYYNKVNPKYGVAYIDNSAFIPMTQIIVDEFSQTINGVSLVVIMDKNGQVPITTSNYSQKLTGNLDYDIIFSRQKRKFVTAIDVFNNIPDEKYVSMVSEAGEDLELYFEKITFKDAQQGYFIIAAPIGHLKDYQRKTWMYFMSSIIIMAIISGAIAQKISGVK